MYPIERPARPLSAIVHERLNVSVLRKLIVLFSNFLTELVAIKAKILYEGTLANHS